MPMFWGLRELNRGKVSGKSVLAPGLWTAEAGVSCFGRAGPYIAKCPTPLQLITHHDPLL